MGYVIDKELCLDCACCQSVCHFDATSETTEHYFAIDDTLCRGCGQCELICPAGAIFPKDDFTPIMRVHINANECIGCSLCAHNCPVEAISGEVKHPFVIDESQCIHCGLCAAKCPKGAIIVEK